MLGTVIGTLLGFLLARGSVAIWRVPRKILMRSWVAMVHPTGPAGREKARQNRSGRGAVWLARLNGVQEVAGSNPVAPTLQDKGLRLLGVGPFLLRVRLLERAFRS